MNYTFQPTGLALPEELQAAQEAVKLPEVQNLMKELAKFNLGVFMPHMHDERSGDFLNLPEGMMQVENGLKVEFMHEKLTHELAGVPVAWRWQDNGVQAHAVCVSVCTEVEVQSGGKSHYGQHGKA